MSPTFPPKDQPLRKDVSFLGTLVGDVIREQEGEEFFAAVEKARKAAIARRTGELSSADPEAEKVLGQTLRGRDPEVAELLCRAFLTYFRAVNLAERVHRIRRRRDYQLGIEASGPMNGSWEDVLQRLKQDGVKLEAVLEALNEVTFEPVLTAHPTEAGRRALLEKDLRIARALVERLTGPRTPREERVIHERLRAELTAAWQTDPHPTTRPTVQDEREHVLYFLTRSIYQVLPALTDDLFQALREVYGLDDETPEAPALLRCGSWVGGDMDGNPYVTAETLKSSLARHRELILGLYAEELSDLSVRLSQSTRRVTVDPALQDRIETYAELIPGIVETVPPRHRDMPYRVLLRLMGERLALTRAKRSPKDGAYASSTEFLDDLGILRHSLENHGGRRAGAFTVRRLEQRVRAFGFHLASLDQRQDSARHREVIGRLMIDDRWEERPAASRTRRLRQLVPKTRPRPTPPGSSVTVHQTVAVFRALADARRRGADDQALGPFIVSMAEGADDVLSVLFLARWGGLLDGDRVPLDVAPLFETVDDLVAAPDILRELLALPAYREHLAGRGNRQTVMIGYSDSNKDGGLFASRWALRQAQKAMVEAVREYPEVELLFFHGRGGTISRGGGKTRLAVRSSPAGTLSKRLRITEQGEVIASRYGLRGIAVRSLEEALGAVLEVTLGSGEEGRDSELQETLGHTLARTAREAYRELVYGERRFYRYFRLATPIDVIERLMIGSRPSSRRSRAGIANLRAIPWVFAWTQSRHMLPGWYGLGTALERTIEEHGRDTVIEAARNWPFLKKILGDAEMVLAKADLDIAARYSALSGDLGKEIFPRIRDEHTRTVSLLLEMKGADRLLEDDLALRRSIALRNPYVDPLSFLQIDLLQRWRAGERQDEDLQEALLASVHGVAQGLKNTG